MPILTVEAPRPASDPAFEINAITVLDRETLARSEERDLDGVFRGLPSVSLQTPGSRGTFSTLFVRGASSGLGQLSFDGVPLYSSFIGAFNLATVPVDALERVEIVRGASGPRYGSRALGGVIRLESRDAREHGGFLHLEGGSYGTLSETVGGALRGANARATMTASHDDVFEDISVADARNGNSERDGFRSTQGVARLTVVPTSRLTLESSVLYRQSRQDVDAPGLLPTGQIGFVDELGGFAGEETWVAQATARGQILPGWESRLQLGYTRNRANGEAFQLPFGFDNRLLLGRWTNT
ncbi:MAG: TonB-dependent receptor, partial [Gammaproteobacteria bacterium]